MKHEHGSGILPLIKYLCALSKDTRLQKQCLHYSEGAKGACANLGNYWSEGLQQCKSAEAIDALIKINS